MLTLMGAPSAARGIKVWGRASAPAPSPWTLVQDQARREPLAGQRREPLLALRHALVPRPAPTQAPTLHIRPAPPSALRRRGDRDDDAERLAAELAAAGPGRERKSQRFLTQPREEAAMPDAATLGLLALASLALLVIPSPTVLLYIITRGVERSRARPRLGAERPPAAASCASQPPRSASRRSSSHQPRRLRRRVRGSHHLVFLRIRRAARAAYARPSRDLPACPRAFHAAGACSCTAAW